MMGTAIRKLMGVFVFSCSSFVSVSAQPSITSTIDKNSILIGQQINLKVVATIPQEDFFVKWIEIPDSLQHFELVEKSSIDSVFTHQKLTGLSQTFTFTSFDSGKWILPAFNVNFNPSSGAVPYNFFTDTFSVDVSYQADSTTILRDIKDIREAPAFSVTRLLLLIAGGVILLALLGWIIYRALKKESKKKPVTQKVLSPYQLAMSELDKLTQLNITDGEAVKMYYTKLTEIVKNYLSAVQGVSFVSSTTSEVLILLKQKGMDSGVVSGIAGTLQRGDAAKFAKYLPPAGESKQSWMEVKQTIELIEQSLIKKEESGT